MTSSAVPASLVPPIPQAPVLAPGSVSSSSSSCSWACALGHFMGIRSTWRKKGGAHMGVPLVDRAGGMEEG